jgi:chromosome segregation ATPase
MDKIPHEKRIEVGNYHVLGYTNEWIEKKVGISHGSTVSIIHELVAGHLVIPGVAADEIPVLHLLSVDLKKKNIDPSQALLGIAFFERFVKLGIEPAEVDHWAKFVELFSPDDFPAEEFFQSALKLHQIEEAEGKPFNVLAGEYAALVQKTSDLKTEIDSLVKQKDNLTENIKSNTSELNNIINTKEKNVAAIELQSKQLKQTNDALVIAEKKLAQTEADVENLEKEKIKLKKEVDGKEKMLKNLQALNFTEEDLLRLRNTLERMSKKSGISGEELKDQFFSALNRFADFAGLEKATQAESKILREMMKQKSLLTGEIVELENQKAILQGEVIKGAAAGADQIQVASKEAVSAIRNTANTIQEEVKAILEDVLEAGLAVGQMRTAQKNGEESGKEIQEIVVDLKSRLGGIQ